MMTSNQLDFTSMTVTPGSSAPSRPLGPYPVSQEAAELTAELTGNWEADVFLGLLRLEDKAEDNMEGAVRAQEIDAKT